MSYTIEQKRHILDQAKGTVRRGRRLPRKTEPEADYYSFEESIAF